MKRKPYLVHNAKNLRTRSTIWETKLWQYLRGGRFFDYKFKRQVAIEKYIVDFCCNEKKLIIELDGSGYQFSEKDKIRDKFFEGLGYKILRIWNNDIDNNFDGVPLRIKQNFDEKK